MVDAHISRRLAAGLRGQRNVEGRVFRVSSGTPAQLPPPSPQGGRGFNHGQGHGHGVALPICCQQGK